MLMMTSITSVTLPERTDPFNLKDFFKTRRDLNVGYDFTDRILSVTKEVESLPAIAIYYCDLTELATDDQIKSELSSDHVFQDTSAFCVYLADMIEKQAKGEKGDLINTGFANIFYVVGKNGAVFAVRVHWRSGCRRWDVDADQLGGLQWIAGVRVFSTQLPARSSL